jgi:hypothetical protein
MHGSEVVKSYTPATLYPSERFLALFLLEAESTPGAIVRLERLCQLKNSMTSGFEPVIVRLVAQCLNQLRYRVHPNSDIKIK